VLQIAGFKKRRAPILVILHKPISAACPWSDKLRQMAS
jgi:hypothetical protein